MACVKCHRNIILRRNLVNTSFACLRINNTDVQNDFSLKPEKWFCMDMAETGVIKIKYYSLFFKDFIRSK